MKTGYRSIAFYSFFVVLAAAGVVYAGQIKDQFPSLRIWSYTDVLWLLVGFPFLWWQKSAGLPEAFTAQSPFSKSILLPLGIGILFGLADLFIIEGLLTAEAHTSLPPYTQPFPYSLFLYGSGGFEIEVFYRLIPVTLVLMLFNVVAKGKYSTTAFWVIAVLSSLREPLEQLPSDPAWFIGYSFLTGFGMNFIQVLLYRKYGFAASVTVRMGHYLIWHILNGIYIQFFVLS